MAGFLEMRLGKTLVAIRVIKLYKPLGQQLHILVVAPNAALGAWVRELGMEGEESLALLNKGTRQARLKLLEENRKWNLMNKEGWEVLPETAYMDWDAVVLDESIFIKNPKASVTKWYVNRFADVPHRWILSGLPAPEGKLDYITQFLFLWGRAAWWGCKSYYAFRAKYCELVDIKTWDLKPDMVDPFRDQINKYAFIMGRKDVGMDNKKVYQERTLELPKDLRKAYQKAEQKFLLEYGDTVKKTMYTMVQFQWLRQLCGGFIDKQAVWYGKIMEVVSLITGELSGQQVVIWCEYIHEILELSKNLGYCPVVHGAIQVSERYNIFEGFRQGAYQIVICHPACAKYGVDLSTADTEIFYSNPTSLDSRLQAEDRIAHPRKKGPLLVLDLIVENSIEEDIKDSLLNKEADSRGMLRVLKKMKGRVYETV